MKTTKTLFILTILAFMGLFTSPTITAQPACQAGFVYTIGTITPNGATVTLYDSSWSAGTIVGWSWSFGNGTGSTQQNPVAQLNPGANYVCLTITALIQNITCTSTLCDTIYIGSGTGCSAAFNATTNVLGTQFTSTSPTNISWLWDFGDGSTSTAQNPLHFYTANGTYNVCLTVTDANGTTCTSCQNITIGSAGGCQAYFTSNNTSGSTYVFTDQSQGNATNFTWSFGDGTSSTLQNPTHTYTSTGYYSVCLTIQDANTGCTDMYCDSIYVQTGTGCNATFGYQTSPAGTFFNASQTNNVSWVWDFGDGSSGTGANVTHVYTTAGTYNACLTVTTANGVTCTSCQNVVIQNNALCSSNFAIYPDSLVLHSYYAYNLASGVAPLSYTWSWGDGTSSNTAYPSHTYASAGLYTICLTITDAVGCSSNTCYQFSLLRLAGAGVPVTVNVIAGSTGVNEINVLNSLIVSPNPASDLVNAGFNLSQEAKVEYSIKNITGQNIYTSPSANYRAGSHEIKVDVSEFPSGLYLLELTTGDQKSYSKIVVQ